MEKNTFFTLISFIALIILISNLFYAAAYSSKIEPYAMQTTSNTENIKVILKFKDSSIQSLELKKDSLLILEHNESIEKIYFDYPVKADLYETIPLINAPASWAFQSDNLNLTGIGQSICIIDTGVNYMHPDLSGCLGKTCKVLGGYDFVNSDNDPIDDHGHGTHIASIAAANGAIKGVAPNTNIIAVKVLDSLGNGYSSDVIKGIEFCINHSKEYNISSIVLSLSTDCSINPTSCSAAYCEISAFSNSIKKATENNISVLAAAGNKGIVNMLPSPACVRNAIPIAASDKHDAFWPNSNRNANIKLIAPGKDIYSLSKDGYGLFSGTSAAAPHIAGAIAILSQYFMLTNNAKTPREIELLLEKTGKNINDPISLLNFSRPDIEQALLQSDAQPPITTLDYPKNHWTTAKKEQNFSCSATDWQIKEITFHLFNISDNVLIEIYNYSADFSGSFGYLNISIPDLSLGNYAWTCSARDAKENLAPSNEYNQFSISTLASNLIYPEDTFITNNETIFSCLAESEHELKQTTFFIWNSSQDNSTEIYNYSLNISGFENISFFDFNFTDEGDYYWNCLVENNESRTFFPINYSITYNRSFINSPTIEDKFDVIKPVIIINSGGGEGGGKIAVKSNQTNNNKTNISSNTLSTLENKTKDISIASSFPDSTEIIGRQTILPEKRQISSITGAVIEAMNSDSKLKLAIYIIISLIVIDILLTISIRRMKKHIKK